MNSRPIMIGINAYRDVTMSPDRVRLSMITTTSSSERPAAYGIEVLYISEFLYTLQHRLPLSSAAGLDLVATGLLGYSL